ncbi:MAG: alpha/beta hydrolase, partial [Anaerolineales bacterium]|nr:alpha/beta hydrolase [Anaerolineales bacterium]
NFFTGDRYDAVVEGTDLMGVLFQSLYSAEIIPVLPQMITDSAAGDYQLLGLLLSNNLTNQEFFSVGMYHSVQCHEEIGFDSLENVVAAVDQYPQIADLLAAPELDFLLCNVWDSGSADATENEPVSSDIPTLILSGEYDPITPPAWGELAAETLSNSFFFEYPGIGHGASVSGDCPQSMTIAFLSDPTSEPDSGCMADMGGPAFAVPSDLSVADLTLVPFSTDLGIAVVEGVIPDGWEEQFPGVFVRGENGLDQTAVLQQGAPGVPADSFLELFTAQLGLDSDVENVGSYEDVNGRSWDLYASTLQGLPVNISLTESDEATFVILLIANNEDEQAALYEG